MLNLSPYIPIIKRARGYRLYDYHGRRFIDCFQNNGAAILGHRPEKLSRNLKNTISKGLINDLPSVYSERLLKLLAKIFPEYRVFRIRTSIDRALADAAQLFGESLCREDIADPVVDNRTGYGLHGSKGGKRMAFWRPFTAKRLYSSFKAIIPLIPFSLGGAPVIICFKDKAAGKLLESDIVSPILLAGAVHVLYKLTSVTIPDWLDVSLPKSFNIWNRAGIYLSATCSPDEYKNVFKIFLSEGVLISPVYPGVTVIPAELSEGEKKKVIKLLMNINGK